MIIWVKLPRNTGSIVHNIAKLNMSAMQMNTELTEDFLHIISLANFIYKPLQQNNASYSM